MTSPERRLRLFIYARIIVTFLFLASTLLANLQESGSLISQSYTLGLVRLMAFSFFFSLLSRYLLRFEKIRLFVIYLQSIWDVLFVTVLILFTDGVASPYAFLYLLSIMNAGVLLGKREALYTASLCIILYGAIIDFQYFDILAPIGISSESALLLGPTHLFYNLFLHLMGFVLTAVITGHLSERALASESALKEKNIDYVELEQLNSTIVANLETGLLTLNQEGNIRVFNRHAEQLTGVSLEDMYDRHITTFLHGIPDISSTIEPVSGECSHLKPDGATVILAFSAIPFFDRFGEKSGVILNFRDITSLRTMEEALKRAERLTALGELSARMAHEIRNPLAAICGSVQLLAEHGDIPDNDRRLMAIVMREAGRLNNLITEFLSYARPTLPDRGRIELYHLTEEIRLFLTQDPRFTAISIYNHVPLHMVIRADNNQIRQVFINLLCNSAEAMPTGGKVEIEAGFQLSGTDGFQKGPIAFIALTDNGPGIDLESSSHLFEPFWTTKTSGTGLGLAVVYRVMEAHGGTVTVDTPDNGGFRITLMFPVQ